MQEETVSLQCGTSTNLATEEVEDEDATENFEQICSPQYQNLSDVEDVDPPMDFEGVDDIGDDGNGINGDDNGGTAPGTEDQKLKYAIVKCIFEAIQLSVRTGSSLCTVEDLLCYARRMYCRGKEIDEEDHTMKIKWPRDWEQAKKFLDDVGYEDAKEYFICLSGAHKNHRDIMKSATEKCRFCGEAGTIKYYYLGLRSKVKLWVADQQMCEKMTAHWVEKEHWINGGNDRWSIKKEVWDGTRFSELAWFWNPDETWCLPARCVRQGCKNIISAQEISQATTKADGSRELFCVSCCTRFDHHPKYVSGDPRNIAYIGKIIGLYISKHKNVMSVSIWWV